MTPKELRQAAEAVRDNLKRTLRACQELRLKGDTSLVLADIALAEHILATVREDDGEPVTYEWICSLKIPHMENRKILWNFDGYTVSVSSSGAKFHCNHMPIASVETRGQFRSLCKGLGIVLGESAPGKT